MDTFWHVNTLILRFHSSVSVSDDERLSMYEDFANTFRGEKTLQACLIEDLKVSRLYFNVYFAWFKSYQCKDMTFHFLFTSTSFKCHYNCYVVVDLSYIVHLGLPGS